MLSIITVAFALVAAPVAFCRWLNNSNSWLLGFALLPTLFTAYSRILVHAPIPAPLLPWMATLPIILISTLVIVVAVFHVSSNWRKISNSVALKFSHILPVTLGLLAGYFAFAAYAQSVRLHIDNDISVYFLEAARIAQSLRDGLSLQEYFNLTGTKHPHDISYSLYLTWGFLTSASPGFGDDQVPRLLIGVNHFAAVAGILYFVTSQSKLTPLWFLLALSLIVSQSGWEYQLRALSRDSYVVAPLFVAFGLLLQSQPINRSDMYKQSISHTMVTLFAVLGSLQGHTLGAIYMCAAWSAIGLILLYRHKWAVFRIAELWVASCLVFYFAIQNYLKYSRTESGNLGFAYPYYVDPVLKERFETNRSFMNEPSLFELSYVTLIQRGVGYWVYAIAIAASLLIWFRFWNKRNLISIGDGQAWLCTAFIICVIMSAIYLFPVQMDGITLSAAVVANLRYGFPIALLVVCLVFFSLKLITFSLKTLKTPLYLQRIVLLITVLFVGSLNLATNIRLQSQINERESARAKLQHSLCLHLKARGARKIAIDRNGALYRCPVDSFYLFSEQGSKILTSSSADEFNALLEAERVDVILLELRTKTWWEDAQLFGHLQNEWFKSGFGNLKIFVRPSMVKRMGLPAFDENAKFDEGVERLNNAINPSWAQE